MPFPPDAACDPLRPVRGRGGVWRVAAGWEEALLSPAGPPLHRWLAEGRLEAVKRGRHRTVWRLRLGGGPADANGPAAYLKLCRGGRGGAAKALADPARPFREANAARRAAAAGVAVAAPLLAGRFSWFAPPAELDGFAAGPRWRGGPCGVLITRSADPAVPLTDLLAAADRVPPALRRAVVAALGEAAAKLHAAGLFPGDLHPGNVLLRGPRPAAGGSFELDPAANVEPVLIDLNPLHVRRGAVGRVGFGGRAAKSLGMFAHGCAAVSTAGDRLRFLAAHREALAERGAAGPLGSWRDWIEAADRRRRAEAVRRHARRDRHWRRGCRGVRVVDRETRCVTHLTDPTGLLAGADADPSVRALRLPPHAARAGWETGHALRRRGLAVAEPLLCREGSGPNGGLLIVAAPPPAAAFYLDERAVARFLRDLRGRGYTLDAPAAADFAPVPGGGALLVDPTRARPLRRGERPAELNRIAPPPSPPALRRAA